MLLIVSVALKELKLVLNPLHSAIPSTRAMRTYVKPFLAEACLPPAWVEILD